MNSVIQQMAGIGIGTSLVHLGVGTFHPPMPHSRSRSGDFLQGGRCTRTLSTKAFGGGTRLQELCRGATPIALPYGPLECARPPMLNGTSTFCTRRSVTGSTRNCLSLFQNFWSSRREGKVSCRVLAAQPKKLKTFRTQALSN